MSKPYLSDERVLLRMVEPEDLGFLYQIENDPSLWDIGNLTVPYSRYHIKQYISTSNCDIYVDKQVRFIIERKADGKPIGTIDITDFVPLHSRGEVGIVILDEYRNQGYANAALSLMCEYVFDFLHFKQLVAHVLADNSHCLSLFRSLHFQDAGILKAWMHTDDGYKDVIVMQCIR